MTRVDFRKAFHGEALRRAQSPMAPPNLADCAMPAPTPPPVWRRVLRAPFSLVRRFLVGSLHIKIDHLTRTTAEINMHVATTGSRLKSSRTGFSCLKAWPRTGFRGWRACSSTGSTT
jgi:hypothetical protein